jgi:hypothetical protein
MRRHLANKGKSVMRPIESGEEVAFPSSTEDASSTASGGAEITALVSGPSCHSDATTNSNVSAEVGGPVMDPTMVAAPFGNIVGVATTSGMSQVSVRPVAHLEPVGRRAGTDLVVALPVTAEVAPQAASRSSAPSSVMQGKVTTRKCLSRYVDLLVSGTIIRGGP